MSYESVCANRKEGSNVTNDVVAEYSPHSEDGSVACGHGCRDDSDEAPCSEEGGSFVSKKFDECTWIW